MATDAPEVRIQRMNTLAFIDADPTFIALQPVRRVKLDNGGYREDATLPLRPMQKLRVIPLSDRERPTITVDGREYRAEFALLGLHDATIERNDRWSSNGQEYRVLEVQAGHGYETKALAVRRG